MVSFDSAQDPLAAARRVTRSYAHLRAPLGPRQGRFADGLRDLKRSFAAVIATARHAIAANTRWNSVALRSGSAYRIEGKRGREAGRIGH